MRLGIGIAIIAFLGLVSASAQDIHFSQFQRSYLQTNPGLTGQFDGDFRFNGNLRNQWRSVSEPYQTFAFAVDARNVNDMNRWHAGISFFNDQAGAGQLTTTSFGISIAYSYPLDTDSILNVSWGVQPGFASRRIDFDALSFDSQYQAGAFDPNASSGEDFDRDSYSHFQLHTGIAFTYDLEDRKQFSAGISAFNLTTPDQGFLGQTVNLDRRLTTFLGADYMLDEDWDALPSLLYSRQGTFRELVFGSNIRYHINHNSYEKRKLYAGFWYRNQDALFFSLGMDYNNVHAGVSYDLNTSDLRTASNRRGGFEFSVTYIIKKFRPRIIYFKACPDFI